MVLSIKLRIWKEIRISVVVMKMKVASWVGVNKIMQVSG